MVSTDRTSGAGQERKRRSELIALSSLTKAVRCTVLVRSYWRSAAWLLRLTWGSSGAHATSDFSLHRALLDQHTGVLPDRRPQRGLAVVDVHRQGSILHLWLRA